MPPGKVQAVEFVSSGEHALAERAMLLLDPPYIGLDSDFLDRRARAAVFAEALRQDLPRGSELTGWSVGTIKERVTVRATFHLPHGGEWDVQCQY